MNRIVAKRKLSENVVTIEIKAPEIALNQKPGNYIIVKVQKDSESLPLIISKVNHSTGNVSLFVHTLGLVQQKLAQLEVGDELFDVSGPFGNAMDVKKIGTVVCAAGGIGIVPLYPLVEAYKQAGNKVIVVLGASNARFLLLEEEMGRIADELIVMTDDGSYGREGTVTDAMRGLFYREKIDLVVTYGPIKMIKHSCTLTHMFNIPAITTLFSMNINGEGNNGIYRISVCSHSKYICVDGIDFNAFYPDFDTMIKRMESRLSKESVGSQNYSLQQVV